MFSTDVRFTRHLWLAFMLASFILLFTPIAAPIRAQEGIPITADNIDQVTELLRIGRGTINQVVYNPDGTTLAVATSIGVWLYDAETLETVRFIESPSRVWRLAYAPDGSRIVTGSHDGIARVWDTSSGELLLTIEAVTPAQYFSWLKEVIYSPDGAQFATVDHTTVKVWDAQTGALLRVLEGHTERINKIAYSPDGARIAAGSVDGSLRLWDAETGELQLTSAICVDRSRWACEITDLAFSPDGDYIVTIDREERMAWWYLADAEGTLEPTYYDPTVSPVTFSMAYSPGNPHIAIRNENGEIEIRSYTGGPNDYVVDFVLGEDINDAIFDLFNNVIYVAFSPDGASIVAVSGDSQMQIWNMRAGDHIHTLDEHWRGTTSVAYSPDNTMVAAGNQDGQVRLWDARTGAFINQFDGGYQDVNGGRAVSCLTFSPDGSRIATGEAVIEIETGTEVLDIGNHWDGLSLVVDYSPDGLLIATGGMHGVRLWDAQTGEMLQEWWANYTELTFGDSVAFSPDGTRLAVSHYGTELYDTTTGEMITTLDIESASHDTRVMYSLFTPTLAGHWETLRDFAYSSDGMLIAVSGRLTVTNIDDSQDTITIWDTTTGELLYTLEYGATDLVFSPDGTRIITGSYDGTVRIWGVPNG